MRPSFSIIAAVFAWSLSASGLSAQAPPTSPSVEPRRPFRSAMREDQIAERMNANTVTVISGTPGGTYFRMAADLAFVLDDDENMRVLPVLGKGAGQNAYDVRFLKGVDIGFVRTDTLAQLQQDTRLVAPERRMAYIARLFNDELHVVAAREITDFRQLAGRRVSFDVKGSGTDFTGRRMFDGLGVQVEAVNVDQAAALDLLRRGEISAVVSVAAKPVSVLAAFDGGARFHLLDLPFPENMADTYFPATLSAADYPSLVDPGRTVGTLAVGTILGVYNWSERTDRYRRIKRFVDAFFSKFDEFLRTPRHPKWKEVNLAATVPNWSRFKAAQQFLDRQQQVAGGGEGDRQMRLFLDARRPGPEFDKERLFQEFTRWRETTGRP